MPIKENHSDSTRKPPLFGMLSILFPIVGVLVAYIFAHGPGEQAGWGMGGVAELFVIFFGSLLFGFIAAVVGMLRQERLTILSVVGFILNALPFLYALHYLN